MPPSCSSLRTVAFRLQPTPRRRAVLRVDGRALRSIKPGTRTVRLSLRGSTKRQVVVTVTRGKRTLVRRVYRLCIQP
jgi:hypothetical protein